MDQVSLPLPENTAEGGSTVANAVVKRKKYLTARVKREIIAKHEQGVSVEELADQYNRQPRTIYTVLLQKEKLTKTATNDAMYPGLEKQLLNWIHERHLQGEIINRSVIRQQAVRMYLQHHGGTTSDTALKFTASNEFYVRFRTRNGLANLLRKQNFIGPAYSTAPEEVRSPTEFIDEFQRLVEAGNYLPQQVFTAVEDGGHDWRQMLNELADDPGGLYRTVLLSANASGDLHIKPLVALEPLCEQFCKPYQTQLSELAEVLYHKYGWITGDMFVWWINHTFCPAVKQYLIDRNLPLQALLVVSSRVAKVDSDKMLLDEYRFLKLLIIPAEDATYQHLLPMRQSAVIPTFKHIYLELLLDAKERAERDDGGHQVRLSIAQCVLILAVSWQAVPQRAFADEWTILWPAVAQSDADTRNSADVDEVPTETAEMDEPADTATEMQEQQQIKEQQSMESPEEQMQLFDDVADMLKSWDKISSYVRNHHPNAHEAERCSELYESSVMTHFRTLMWVKREPL